MDGVAPLPDVATDAEVDGAATTGADKQVSAPPTQIRAIELEDTIPRRATSAAERHTGKKRTLGIEHQSRQSEGSGSAFSASARAVAVPGTVSGAPPPGSPRDYFATTITRFREDDIDR
jgi:hypothetical protein